MSKARVSKSVYCPYKQYPDGQYGAAMVQVIGWGGSSRYRTERLTYSIKSDYCPSLAVRHSQNNGASFSGYETLSKENPRQGGFEREDAWFAVCFDPLRGHDVRFDFQRLFVGTGPEALEASWQGVESYFDHGLYCVSRDKGRTFSAPRLLKYEDGADYDEADWGKAEYLKNNKMYGGYTAIVTRAGTLLYPFSVAAKVHTAAGEQRTCGVRCMLGTWDERADDYRWEVSSEIAVPLAWSGRGLMEPTLAELKDGRVVMGIRGSTDVYKLFCPGGDIKVTQPGRHWLTVSEDGGYHWGPVRDWRYATDEPFYSPSAFARLLRHSNGKLYWIGNICPESPAGNMPRHPLVIAEVDERGPGLVKDSVTVIDTKGEHEQVAAEFQLSNFYVLENEQTRAI
ncbi:MAG: sialidase family protein [bacterium]